MDQKCKIDLMSGSYSESLSTLYPIGSPEQVPRYSALVDGFVAQFGTPKAELRLFSSPGRTELGGNHTDHQHGRVLAAAVQMDIAAVVEPTNNSIIEIYSEGFGVVTVDTASLEKKDSEINSTAAVIRGVCARLSQLDYKIGGFKAYCNSTVPVGSGLSSSAAFENLVTTVQNVLYNNNVIKPILIAQIGQYAENVYFGKPSGLMDQAASAFGGVISIDFQDNDNPQVEFLSLNLSKYGYSLCVVNTGGDHADLTDDYAGIFHENKEIANYFGKDVLREVDQAEFYSKIPELRSLFSDRAVIRGMHFFDDNDRVVEQVSAIKAGNFDLFKKLVLDSGESSFNRLQNVFSSRHPKNQPISLALEYSRKLLSTRGGSWRVHGGGFAGTIQTYVPNDFLVEYKEKMDYIFGEDATQVLAIRPVGSCELTVNA